MQEPQKNEIYEVQPSSLRHIVGQKGVVDAVAVAIDACQIVGRRFDHSLMIEFLASFASRGER